MIYLVLVFLGGVFTGLGLASLFFSLKSGHGYFKLEPYDEDDTGFYRINIRLYSNQNLLKKKYIILEKDNSQK